MGGYGSGRWGYYTKKDTVEECRCFDIRDLRRQGFLQRGRVFSGTSRWLDFQDQEIASLGWTTTDSSTRLYYTIHWRERDAEKIGYQVPVVWTPCNLGGERPWFVCPGSRCGGRRVAKLYLPPGAAKYYLCRHCHDLTYRSRQEWDKRVAFLRRSPEARIELLRKLDDSERSSPSDVMLLLRSIGPFRG